MKNEGKIRRLQRVGSMLSYFLISIFALQQSHNLSAQKSDEYKLNRSAPPGTVPMQRKDPEDAPHILGHQFDS